MSTPRGLYLLADESVLPFEQWHERLVPCLSAGIALVQYRAKAQSAEHRHRHATTLLAWCREAQVPLVINDDLTLARAIRADGVHVGASDIAVVQARESLGSTALVGSSCYNDLTRAQAMRDAGANYVSFGRLFTSKTKPEAKAASLDTVSLAAETLGTTICAIGGIDSSNAERVLHAGADLICVAGGILGQTDPCAATRKLATIVDAAFARR